MPGPQRRDASGNTHPKPPPHHPHHGNGNGGGGNATVFRGGGSYAGLDQGVDWTGNFTLHTPDDMKITRVDTHSGWPGGTIIVGRLMSGPYKGRYVYFAEAIQPAPGLQVGAVLGKGELIGSVHSGYPGSESGFAKDAYGTAYGNTSEGKDGNAPDPQAQAWASYIGVGSGGAASGGGTGGGGTGGGVPAAIDTHKPQTVKQYLDDPQIAQTYGYLAAYLHNKQIGPILAKAAKHGWGQDELLGALEKTKWWKNTAESTRSWEAQKRLDPATAHQRLDQMRQQIQQLALSTLGSHLDPNRAMHMANAALSANWNQAQLQAAIGAEFHYQGAQAKYKGAAGQTVDQLQQLSSQYLVPLGHQAMQHWGRQILEGSTTVADYTSYLQAQAESLFPTLTHALRSGQTVAQFADPYLQMASQILEKPTGEFNLLNPKWGKALSSRQPNGQRAPMSLPAWGDYLRGLPEYKTTQQAQQQGAAFSNSLLNIFGKISTPNSVPSAAGG